MGRVGMQVSGASMMARSTMNSRFERCSGEERQRDEKEGKECDLHRVVLVQSSLRVWSEKSRLTEHRMMSERERVEVKRRSTGGVPRRSRRARAVESSNGSVIR